MDTTISMHINELIDVANSLAQDVHDLISCYIGPDTTVCETRTDVPKAAGTLNDLAHRAEYAKEQLQSAQNQLIRLKNSI